MVGDIARRAIDNVNRIENVLASVAVKDLAAATKWYEKVF